MPRVLLQDYDNEETDEQEAIVPVEEEQQKKQEFQEVKEIYDDNNLEYLISDQKNNDDDDDNMNGIKDDIESITEETKEAEEEDDIDGEVNLHNANNNTTTTTIDVNNNNDNLVIALRVKDHQDAIPFEFDPDVKQSYSNNKSLYNNRRFRLYSILVLSIITIAVIGISIGLTKNRENNNNYDFIPYRETLGIRENIQIQIMKYHNVDVNSNNELDNINSPYRKALDWLIHMDKLQLTPDDRNFYQRFYAAYFYYATSIQQPWDGGCSPLEDKSNDDVDDNCAYKYLAQVEPSMYWNELPGKRWLGKSSECYWAGISCNENDAIYQIRLSGNNMTGSFPVGILHGLPYLLRLTMSYGMLQGPLPDSFTKYLGEINLNNNLFTGTIPNSLYTSQSRTILNLENNQFVGNITGIIRMKNAIQLLLSNNMLSGSIPSYIDSLRSLRNFYIDGNKITGTLPTTFGKIEDMRWLFLQKNRLHGTIPTEIGNLRNMVHFYLQSNKINGTIPEELFNCTSLSYLDVHDNQLTGTLSSQIGKLTTLYDLKLQSNSMSGTIPTELAMSSKLLHVLISDNNFVGSVPDLVCTGTLLISTFEADCAGATPELSCNCCTSCCLADGTKCVYV